VETTAFFWGLAVLGAVSLVYGVVWACIFTCGLFAPHRGRHADRF
jgi:hypothetical protein